MVTGIEVAGVALAVFPIVVNGLSRFAEGVETIKSWRRYRRELAGYARTLECQQIWYLDTIEELLDGIVHSEDELASLSHDPGGDAWQKPEHEAKLKRRLDHSYSSYMSNMTNMLAALKSIQNRLGMPSSDQVAWEESSVIEREIKRVKLVLSKNVYTGLLAQIDKANKELREITHQNRYLEPVRRKRRSQPCTMDFKVIRSHAKSLYNVIVTGRSWRCQCREDHVANLRLELRPLGRASDNAAGKPRMKFRVLLSKNKPQTESDALWTWQELDVEPVQVVSTQQHTMAHSDVQNPRNDFSLHRSKTLPGPPRNTVKFALADSLDTTLFSPAMMLSPRSENRLSPIMDFCTILNQVCGAPKALGYLLDEGAEHHRHDVCLVNNDRVSTGSKSLANLLRISQKRASGYYLSRKDRLHLAVVLASSVLQLDGTSWLRNQWRSHDILFLQTEDSLPELLKVDYACPFLSTKISSECSSPPSMITAPTTCTTHLIRCEVLFALGLTLIELCFGETLAEMQTPNDADNIETITSYRTANRLLDYVYNESGSRYGDVVRRHVQYPFGVRNPSLDNSWNSRPAMGLSPMVI